MVPDVVATMLYCIDFGPAPFVQNQLAPLLALDAVSALTVAPPMAVNPPPAPLLFSFVGVFWAFLFTGTSMGIMGMIGMLVLMGIVVNNGIVLVDRINQLRNEQPDAELVPLIIEACEARLRPILMTVSTTVLGLLPLAFGDANIGGDGPSYAPMAIAIIGGLVFSTLTSLLLVPLTYWGLIRFNIRWSGFLAKARVLANKVITAP